MTTIFYRDITSEPDGRGRADFAPELRQGLLDLGFAPLGILETKAPGLMPLEVARMMLSEADAQFLTKTTEEGEVCEVFNSPDYQCFAEVAQFFGGPLTVLFTVLENGAMIETAMRPRRAPQPPDRGQEGAIFSFPGPPKTPPLWSHNDHPEAGYYVELAPTRSPADLWNRHKERVLKVSKGGQNRITRHDSLELYLCTPYRAHQVMNQEKRLRTSTLKYSTIPLFIILALTFFALRQIPEWYGFILGLIIFAAALLGLGFLMTANQPWFDQLIGRLIPGPKMQGAAQLMEIVHRRYSESERKWTMDTKE